MRLVGTTKPTIESIRSRSHWNSNNLQPTDPVALGLCSQIDLDFEVEKAAKNSPRPPVSREGATLLPASETTTTAAAAALAAAAARPERSAAKEEADEAERRLRQAEVDERSGREDGRRRVARPIPSPAPCS